MNKHTPGPWVVTGQSSSYITVAAKGRTIARVPFSSEADGFAGKATDAADAALIAAAPDLLAALAAMVESDDAHWPITTARQVRDAARAAIAKARGQA